MPCRVTGEEFLLGLVLLSAGVPKVRNPRAFRAIVSDYHLLPSAVVRPVSHFLPLLECVCGAALIAGYATRIAAAVAAGLLTCFTVAVAINLVRGRRINCGCSGRQAPTPISWGLVARNLVLIGIAGFVLARGVGGKASSVSDQLAVFATVATGLVAAALARSAVELRQRLHALVERSVA